MFRKKEYAILMVIAAALIAYLSLHQKDKTHYQLPEAPPLETGEITRIDIASPSGKKSLKRKDDRWYVEPEGYLVDNEKATDMLEVIGKLTITDLVSSSANYTRYELDEAQKISVSAWEGSTAVRTLEIGKAAPTFQHTYLRFGDDENVYQARGHFRLKFDQSAEELRDKRVLTFNADDIQSIDLAMEGASLGLTKDTQRPPAAAETAKETPTQANQDQEKALWRSDTGIDIDQNTVKTLLSDLSALECTQFINDGGPDGLTPPTLQITLTGKEEHTLAMFTPEEDDTAKVPARSSLKDTPFFLSEWKATSIKEAAEKLMGKEETPSGQETNEPASDAKKSPKS
jgi:hypothetical protein